MRQVLITILLASISVFLAFAMIKFPSDSFEASIRGLNMWWEVVFPSLLPFFITAELLIGFGVVKFIGVIFEPIMRPLFNVPGVGSFAWSMGMASGYPAGAKISARLREEKQLSQVEAERLISFTNASSPLFIFAAVSVGFFHDAKLGVLLAACHYIGNTLVGICMRFYGRNKKGYRKVSYRKKISFIQAFKEMHRTRVSDTRPVGEIVGDAVLNSIKTLMMIGGFIILFSVFTKLLFLIGITPLIATFFEYFLEMLALPSELALPFISGLFEITLGAQAISQSTTTTLLAKIIIVSFILGFNGFSVQAQVASITAKTDIRFAPYFFSRLLHGIFASILTVILFKPLYLNRQVFEPDDIPVTQEITQNTWTGTFDMLTQAGPIFTILSIGTAVFILYKRRVRRS